MGGATRRYRVLRRVLQVAVEKEEIPTNQRDLGAAASGAGAGHGVVGTALMIGPGTRGGRGR